VILSGTHFYRTTHGQPRLLTTRLYYCRRAGRAVGLVLSRRDSRFAALGPQEKNDNTELAH
jgi:hypothetical protein